MSLPGLVKAVSATPGVSETLLAARSGTYQRLIAPSAVVPALAAGLDRPVLLITASDRAAAELAEQLQDFLKRDEIEVFPAWETLPHERLSPSSDTVGQRVAVLHRLAHGAPLKVLVAPVRAVIQPFVRGLAELEPIRAKEGTELPLDDFVRRLTDLGFERVDLVERRGQYAVRGGLVDVFPPTHEHPLRVEYWGDTIEEIRTFSVADQRSIGKSDLFVTACRELLLTDAVRDKAARLAALHPEFADILSKLAQGIATEGMESLIPALVDGLDLLLDHISANWLIVEVEPERIETRAAELVATGAEFLEASWQNAAAGNVTPIDLGDSGFRSYATLRGQYSDWAWLAVTPLPMPDDVVLPIELAPDYRGRLDEFAQDVRDWAKEGRPCVAVMAGHGSAQRLAERLAEFDLNARLTDDLELPLDSSLIHVTTGHTGQGLLLTDLAVVTEVDLFGQKDASRSSRNMPSRRARTIDPLTLKAGDFVVHDQHGIGRYVEMAQRTVAGATREYLVIEYASSKRGQPGDKLYVPTDQLDHVTRYLGGEAPSVHRLGGGDWQKAKARARKAVRQIAGELIRLYAARMASKGHAFGPDTDWQRELEDAFEYVETPDQLATIEEVKADMERDVPMDRLICGDVGYGKTEIAVRAAFKAIQDGKQVAVLVPTTLLVQQHMETFGRRYAQFPVKIAALSRFQTDAQAREVIAGIQDGSLDLVIGTHRLFSPEVRFRDLGLVIVDEEQRFGVEHKEHLKALRTNVDMLTMSATPIPRTLEMAVTGLREMSTIQTPPEDRHPVLTYVGAYDEKQISAAIHRELIRDGQVFFVHNRVASIQRAASRIAEFVPEARIAVAHGQMNEHQLEQIIVDFWNRRYDVLVSTTIIESGLDIPNANTLIVDRADTFGLSQLHQIRGRVGRSRERGYAYFLYPPEKPLTEQAHDRLATIAAHTDLGSGMAVALKDLEIRGAGNLLGGEQSGHIADVGFDLYVRMVGEAVAEGRDGGQRTEAEPVRLEIPVDAHLPHNYIREERLRLQAYRSLADANSDAEIDDVVAELQDRYGRLPEPVETLVAVARLRAAVAAAGITEVIAAGANVRFSPVQLAESAALRLARLYPGSVVKAATRTIVVPRPRGALGVPGQQMDDRTLINWVSEIVRTVLAS